MHELPHGHRLLGDCRRSPTSTPTRRARPRNCAQCHGPTVAGASRSRRPTSRSSRRPRNHIPTTAACESCHVGAGSSIAATPVVNGAKFAGSAMSHAGITTCVGCHGPTIGGRTFVGITKIVVMPADLAGGPERAHPVGDRLRELPSGLDAVRVGAGECDATVAPGTNSRRRRRPPRRSTPASRRLQQLPRRRLTSGWTMAKYPLAPTDADRRTRDDPVHGLPTRGPGKTASTFNLADAAHPACRRLLAVSHRHRTTSRRMVKPANHIPTANRAVHQLPHGHRLLGDADADQHPRLRTEHERPTARSATARGAPTLRDPGRELLDRDDARPITCRRTAACEVCHVGAGLEHRRDAGRRTAPSSPAPR